MILKTPFGTVESGWLAFFIVFEGETPVFHERRLIQETLPGLEAGDPDRTKLVTGCGIDSTAVGIPAMYAQRFGRPCKRCWPHVSVVAVES